MHVKTLPRRLLSPRALTLVELLAVLVIIGVVASVAVVGAGRLQARAAADTAFASLESVGRQAGMTAQAERAGFLGADVDSWFAPGGGQDLIVYEGEDDVVSDPNQVAVDVWSDDRAQLTAMTAFDQCVTATTASDGKVARGQVTDAVDGECDPAELVAPILITSDLDYPQTEAGLNTLAPSQAITWQFHRDAGEEFEFWADSLPTTGGNIDKNYVITDPSGGVVEESGIAGGHSSFSSGPHLADETGTYELRVFETREFRFEDTEIRGYDVP